jgi:hypothetical protein
MAKINTKGSSYMPKKTSQGSGTYSRSPHSGGETYHDGQRAGSTPSNARRRKKPYRGQGR